jgi:branched-chain amino acid transport system substrate-binding protein
MPGLGNLKVAEAAGSTVTIGVDLPLSGADAQRGIPTRNGVALALEDSNANPRLNGGLKFTMSALDDAVGGVHDPRAGSANVNTFIADPSVLGVIGPLDSSVAAAQIKPSNDAGLVLISPSATDAGLTRLGASTFFRVCATDALEGAIDARFAGQFLGAKKAFVIDDGDVYGERVASAFTNTFKSLSGDVLRHESIAKGQQDFSALLALVKSENPDAIFFGGTTASGGGILREQMTKAGMPDAAFFGGDGIGDAAFLNEAGASANFTYYSVAAPETSKLPSAKKFSLAYAKRFHASPGPYSAEAYAATQILVAAIVKASKADGGKVPSRAEVRKYVAATKRLATPLGKIGFDEFGDSTGPIESVYQIKNGKPMFVKMFGK